MLSITTKNYADAFNLGVARSASLLGDVLIHTPGPLATRRYSFANALMTVKPKYRRGVSELLANTQDDGGFYVGQDQNVAAALCCWIEVDSVMAARLKTCRSKFGTALGSMRSSSFYADFESLRLLLPLSGSLIGYILTGSTDKLPTSWIGFAKAFACIHATSDFDNEMAMAA